MMMNENKRIYSGHLKSNNTFITAKGLESLNIKINYHNPHNADNTMKTRFAANIAAMTGMCHVSFYF